MEERIGVLIYQINLLILRNLPRVIS